MQLCCVCLMDLVQRAEIHVEDFDIQEKLDVVNVQNERGEERGCRILDYNPGQMFACRGFQTKMMAHWRKAAAGGGGT